MSPSVLNVSMYRYVSSFQPRWNQHASKAVKMSSSSSSSLSSRTTRCVHGPHKDASIYANPTFFWDSPGLFLSRLLEAHGAAISEPPLPTKKKSQDINFLPGWNSNKSIPGDGLHFLSSADHKSTPSIDRSGLPLLYHHQTAGRSSGDSINRLQVGRKCVSSFLGKGTNKREAVVGGGGGCSKYTFSCEYISDLVCSN